MEVSGWVGGWHESVCVGLEGRAGEGVWDEKGWEGEGGRNTGSRRKQGRHK